MTELSLVVCTYRRPAAVRKLLMALREQTRMPDEILVVDASPDIDTEEALRELGFPGVVYLRVPPQERGLTCQRNWGVAQAHGRLISFLDDDTVPEPDYFAELLACLERHPGAAGVGGAITGTDWRRVKADAPEPGLAVYRSDGWERREDLRWRLRRLLGLASGLGPGRMPPSGHARSVGFLPPDGRDHAVDFFMGGASLWRREVVESVRFSPWFEGYGLYEDLDFCLRAARHGSLVLCTRARLAHHHEPSGRPDRFRYGTMVVRNGWRVWRTRWPAPSWPDRARWWATSLVLAFCRLGDTVRGPARTAALSEALGRFWGSATLLWNRPEGDDA